MLKGLIIGFLCFILFFIIHIIIFHLFNIKERFRTIKITFYAFTLGYVLAYILIPVNILMLIPADLLLTSRVVLSVSKILNFITGYILYVFLFIGYCQFYFFIDRTITGRMMIEFETSPAKKLSYEEMKHKYPPDDVFKRRLHHILESNCIVIENGRYKNTKKGHYIAVMSKFLKDFLKLDPGG